jgi:hypothetical protein
MAPKHGIPQTLRSAHKQRYQRNHRTGRIYQLETLSSRAFTSHYKPAPTRDRIGRSQPQEAVAMTIHPITSAAVALALALGAQATPAAAWVSNINAHGSYVPSPTTNTQGPAAAGPRPTILRVNSRTGGFDWGDAGIGAAGGIAVSMLGLGTALALTGRRTPRPTAPRA